LATTKLGGRGRAPGLHSDISSSARRSVWCHRSIDASYTRRKSSPKIYSFVTLATNAQIFRWRRPRFIDKKTSFKTVKGFCRYCLQCVMLMWLPFWPSGGDVEPGHSYVRPGVLGHEARFFTDQPYVAILGSAFSVIKVTHHGGLTVYGGFLPSPPPPLVSRRLATLPVHFSVVTRSPFGLSWRFLCVAWRLVVTFLAAARHRLVSSVYYSLQ
jgi:hypothetical protein